MKKRQNEEMKFIGIDGFEEIESLTTEEKQTAEKPVKQTSAVNVMNTIKETAAKLAQKVKNSKVLRASKKKEEPVHTANKQEHTVYKKRAVLAVAASVTAVMLSFATVASALDGNNDRSKAQQSTTAPVKAATIDEPLNSTLGMNQSASQGTSALYIDGKLIGAVKSGNELQSALDAVLANAKADYDDTTTTEFANAVEVKPYNGNDSLTTVDALMAQAADKLSIKLETDWTYETETGFDTDITYDESQPSSYEEVTQEGVNGVSQITIRLTYTDGIQTDAVITDEKVISEAVTEKKTIGCSDGIYKTAESGSGSGVASGNFIWPFPHTHSITSYMEWRWGRMHNGIDIAGGGDYGEPFIAADGGTVVWSGNDGGGYGNYVMIDHGNGYMTVYGHASALACSTGDYVSQGQTIGYVGSTGNSTGPHLHFEIRLNGDYQDPLNYVS